MGNKLTQEKLYEILHGISQDKEIAIREKVEQVFCELEEKLGTPPGTYQRAEIVFDLQGTRAGVAHNGREKKIRVNAKVATENFEEYVNQVVPHEVCHIVQRQEWPHSKPHGYEWAHLMILLGLSPDRTHSMKVEKARKHKKPYMLYCACGEHPVSRHKMARMAHENAQYVCRRCKQVLRRHQ